MSALKGEVAGENSIAVTGTATGIIPWACLVRANFGVFEQRAVLVFEEKGKLGMVLKE